MTSRAAYHRDCLNAESYFERRARAQLGASALMKFKTSKPREFRYKVMEPLTSSNKRRRGADERMRATELCEDIAMFSNVYRQRYIFMLGERAFQQWRRLYPVSSQSIGQLGSGSYELAHV